VAANSSTPHDADRQPPRRAGRTFGGLEASTQRWMIAKLGQVRRPRLGGHKPFVEQVGRRITRTQFGKVLLLTTLVTM
jgi:hypothetical protein